VFSLSAEKETRLATECEHADRNIGQSDVNKYNTTAVGSTDVLLYAEFCVYRRKATVMRTEYKNDLSRQIKSVNEFRKLFRDICVLWGYILVVYPQFYFTLIIIIMQVIVAESSVVFGDPAKRIKLLNLQITNCTNLSSTLEAAI
jgi:hypothetical protein